jgi:23S rRNA-/tRNA-specific pseudouridylate synthase
LKTVEPLEFSVTPESEGQRLDRFLVTVLEDHSRSQIQKLITDGHVHVSARDARPNLAVRAGDPRPSRRRPSRWKSCTRMPISW